MAANFNQVILMGNMTRDIEVRFTPQNTAVGTFGLAVNRTWTTPQGEKREEVSFIDCEAWGKAAELLKQYTSKGSPLFVSGRLKQDTWEDKNGGGKRSKIKVVVEDFRFIGSRGGQQGGNQGGEYDQSAPSPQVRSGRSAQHAAGDDAPPPIGEADIPF
ncbi:MAG: single-stranded DNA-binding protein [Phycisphaerales bacterium]